MLNALIFFSPELSLELRRVRRGLPVVRHLLHDGHERVAADGRDGLRLPRHIQQHAEPLPHAAQGWTTIRVLLSISANQIILWNTRKFTLLFRSHKLCPLRANTM